MTLWPSQKSILGKKLDTSVELNDVFIPASSLQETLSNYTCPLIVDNNHPIYKFGLIGSCIPIFYDNNYYLICTRHQIKNRNPKDVGLLDKDGYKFCSSSGVVFYEEIYNEVELHDLVILKYTQVCHDRPEMIERFFPVRYPPEARSDDFLLFIASGFPSKEQDYGFANNENCLGFKRLALVCSLAEKNEQSTDETHLCLKMIEESKYDLDGMSGGAVFGVQMVNNIPCAFLHGMMTRAGNGYVHFIKIDYILNLISDSARL
jgi:hypothetical protein